MVSAAVAVAETNIQTPKRKFIVFFLQKLIVCGKVGSLIVVISTLLFPLIGRKEVIRDRKWRGMNVFISAIEYIIKSEFILAKNNTVLKAI